MLSPYMMEWAKQLPSTSSIKVLMQMMTVEPPERTHLLKLWFEHRNFWGVPTFRPSRSLADRHAGPSHSCSYASLQKEVLILPPGQRSSHSAMHLRLIGIDDYSSNW